MPRPKRQTPPKETVGFRLDAETLRLIDQEQRRLESLHPGLAPSRSDVLRMLVREAFDSRKRGK